MKRIKVRYDIIEDIKKSSFKYSDMDDRPMIAQKILNEMINGNIESLRGKINVGNVM